LEVSGVRQCAGWQQKLTEDDRSKRLEIKSLLPATYVVCENVFNGDNCSPEEKGNLKAQNDCRYWYKRDGKDFNPCKDLVPHYDKPKIMGDIRYSYIYWVTNPHFSSPLGYGPSAADPDTGQLFWGTAHIYGGPITTYSLWAKELVDLLNGDLDLDSVATGKYIREYLKGQSKTANEKVLPGAAFGHDHHGHAHGRADHDLTLAAAKQRATLDISSMAIPHLEGAAREAAEKELHHLENPKHMQAKFGNDIPLFDLNAVQTRMEKIKGTKLERALINDEVALVLSEGEIQPGDMIGPEQIDKISPAGWATPKKMLDDKKRMQFLGINNIYLAEFQDPAIIGLAKRLKCDDGESPTATLDSPDNIGDKVCYKGPALRQAVENAIFRGVLEHEIGHTVGLRHNFSASADVLNYFDGYFDPNTGRERESVLCAEFSSRFGTVSANDMCEDNLGEECAYVKCSSDTDCAAGLACGNGECVDSNGTKVGLCEGTKEAEYPCSDATADQDCGAAGVCVAGVC
jgi:hypothetical protein